MKTYITELATYEIKEQTDRRVDGFVNGKPIWVESTTYRIFKDDKFLTCCYDENDIAYVVDCQENSARYAMMTSRFD